MASVSIDGKEYQLDDISDEAKSLVASLNFVRAENLRISNLQQVYKRAEGSYAEGLKNILENEKK